jgi:hypothetical protein
MKALSEDKIIDELDIIIATCNQLKDKATGLRKKLGRVYAPAPAKGKKAGLTPAQKAHILYKRNKHLKAI